MSLDKSDIDINISESEENISDINVSDADASETKVSESNEENVTIVDSEAEEEELNIVETTKTMEDSPIIETSVSDNLQIVESSKDIFELTDDISDEEFSNEEIDLINDLILYPYSDVTYADISVASSSNIQGYEDVVINRLNNILTCTIISACCAFLILFHTLKKE